MWACCLQFIHFSVQPSGFMVWNSILCIVMFVAYVGYVFVGCYHLWERAGCTQVDTFKEIFDGTRIKGDRFWYFALRYLKLLAIAFIIGQLYSANPLAALIPLIVIHLADAAVITFLNPFIEGSNEREQIVSRCTRVYWKYYRFSHVV